MSDYLIKHKEADGGVMLSNLKKISLLPILFLASISVIGCQSSLTKENKVMNVLPDEFSFSSREWIKDNLPDSVAAMATVKKLGPQVYAVTYQIKPDVINAKTQIMGTNFSYNWSELSNFHLCVVGSITAKAGFANALLGHSSEQEQLGSPVTFYIAPFTGSISQSPAFKGVEWSSKSMDYATSAEFKAQCATYIKEEYLW